jgi:subtilase family serine protease
MRSWKLLLPLLASSVCLAQTDRIPAHIDSSQFVTLAHSVHPKARPEYDRGPVEPSLQLGYVTLQIPPSPSQQQDLDQLLAQQQNPSSPSHHKWLTPEQYAARFGLSQNDIKKVSTWLESQGLTVLRSARGRNGVTFSGSAAQIQAAFRTEIHNYNVNGEKHIANTTPAQIPAALSGVVTGITGLHNFKPKPMFVRPVAAGKANPHPRYTTTIGTDQYFFLAPGDIATLYDVNGLYNATPTPINGVGQSLAVMGQTDIYLADLTAFRSGFSLPAYTCSTDANGIITDCPNPTYLSYILVGSDEGVSTNDLLEADLDVEWSGAVAPNAQIIFVNGETSNGVFDALTYAIDNAIAPVMTISYGLCEAGLGGFTLEPNLQQANAEGITVMNSAGDTGADTCDNQPPGTTSTSSPPLPYDPAVDGLSVSYPASSPEVTAVGGTSIPAYPTDFYTGSYWSSSNGSIGGSAMTNLIGHEAAWNEDAAYGALCAAGAINAQFCTQGGSTAVSNWTAITNAQTAQEDIWSNAGGGGVSNCYNSTSTGDQVVCVSGFAKPSWQTVTIPGLTSPQSTYRFVPDVSLLASPDFPGYIICTPLEELNGGTDTTSSCASGIATAVDTNNSLIGGTSVSTPVFAAIVTLINQYLGSNGLGNINPTLYSLAAVPSNKYFHPVTTGENDVYCAVGEPAGNPADVICPKAGVFGFSAGTFDTKTFYNLVTGLGSVDAFNLATAWAGTRTAGTTVTLTPPANTNVYQGGPVSFTVAVTPTTVQGAASFSTLNNSVTTALGTVQLNTPYRMVGAGSAVFTTTALPVGTNTITATYLGDATHSGGAVSPSPAVVTVTIPFTMTASPSSLSTPAGQTITTVLTLAPTTGFNQTVNFTNSTASSPGSCTSGLPSGALCSFSPSSVTLDGVPAHTMNVTVTITTLGNMALPSGALNLVVNGTSTGASISTPVSLTITATKQTATLATTGGTTYTVAPGGTASVQINVSGTNGFNPAATPLTYTCTGSPSLSTALIACNAPNSGQPDSATSVTVSLVTTAPTAQLKPPFGGARRIFYALLLPGFGILALAGSRRRAVRLLGLIVVLGVSTLGLGACGGGGSSTHSQGNPGTPAGNYQVTISATTGAPSGGTAITGTTTITLTVN